MASDEESTPISSEVPELQATPHRAVDVGLHATSSTEAHLEPEDIQATRSTVSHYWALLLFLLISMRSTRIGPVAASVLPGAIDHVERSVWLSHTLSVPLSIITVAWWGSLSDYYGRAWVLRWNVTAYVLSDLGLLLLWKTRPSTHGWYMIGPVVEALAGGLPTSLVLLQAYIADTTISDARTRALSQLSGLLFVAMMIGPQISLYSASFGVFGRPMVYTLAAIDTAAMLLIWLLIPESLPSSHINERRQAREQRLQAMGSGRRGWFKRTASTFDIMTPFTTLLPRRPTGLTWRSFDWNLPLIGGAYAITMLIGQSGSRVSAFYDQYYEAAAIPSASYVYITYGWMAPDFFMWITSINRFKGIWLVVLFPAISKLIIHRWTRFRTPRTGSGESEPLLAPEARSQHPPPSSPARLAVSWDLFFARSALATSALFYALATRAKVGAFIEHVLFFAATHCTVFGSHFGPVAQSLALGVDGEPDTGSASNPRTGQLLGALGAMGTLCSHVLGPMLFEFVYTRTESFLPAALYLSHSGLLLVSLVLLMFVRTGAPDVAADLREEGVVGESPVGASPQ